MKIHFVKYQGTGNDFIMVDNRNMEFPKNEDAIANLCDRRFGIGADGLILLELCEDAVFQMVYFNSDGKESSFCGNGGRCITAFAREMGLIEELREIRFRAKDGLHWAKIEGGLIHLGMSQVEKVEIAGNGFFVNTGSPHFVQWVDNLDKMDVQTEGASIRYSDTYRQVGVNVNFVEQLNGRIKVRTYERGVEAETLSCGTGVTAAALVASLHGYSSPVKIETPGGHLEVRFKKSGNSFSGIQLIGPAQRVFEGEIKVEI